MCNALAATKMSQKVLHLFCTEPFNFEQGVMKAASTPSFSVKGIDESVCFISSVYHDSPFPVQNDFWHPIPINRLLSFCQSCKFKTVFKTVFFK